jgi:nascent polypeptide-associated complex subunit alpha
MFRMNPNDLRKMMRRMGVKVDIDEISDAERVIIERTGEKNLVIENPVVTIMKMKGQSMVYIAGEIVEVEKEQVLEKPEIPEEDVQLVAAETGSTLDEARAALEATNGDIAQAIMLLESKKH